VKGKISEDEEDNTDGSRSLVSMDSSCGLEMSILDLISGLGK